MRLAVSFPGPLPPARRFASRSVLLLVSCSDQSASVTLVLCNARVCMSQNPEYVPGNKTGLFIKRVQRTVLMMGRYVEQVNPLPLLSAP